MRAILIRQVAHLPLRECHTNEDWKKSRIASIFLSRNRPDGLVAFGTFAVEIARRHSKTRDGELRDSQGA
jgi:hypothetical protein